MTGPQKQIVAVLMGDLVRSESAQSADLLYEHFNAVVSTQNDTQRAALLSPLTITLGDEFQGLIKSLGQAVQIAQDIRLDLMAQGVACRFVIGLAEIHTPLNRDKAWNMMGPGLGRARDILNDKKPGQFYRFSLPDAPLLETLLDALGMGLSAIEAGWTDRQRSDITALMGRSTPADLAEARGVSVHSVYKVRAAGHFDTYAAQWAAVRMALDDLDAQKGLGG